MGIDNFPNGGIKTRDDVPDALDTYVKVLEAQPDKSVTIAAIGFPMNIRDVLKSNPDLFEQKVKAIYWMDGFYNFGCAYNGEFLGSTDDCLGASQEIQQNIPVTVEQYFQPNGKDMCTGGLFYNNSSYSDNPVARAYNDIANDF